MLHKSISYAVLDGNEDKDPYYTHSWDAACLHYEEDALNSEIWMFSPMGEWVVVPKGKRIVNNYGKGKG
jgi:hypothetical protein